MGRKIKDRTGEQFGKWTIKEFSHTKKYTTWNDTYWKCECACGNTGVCSVRDLKKGKTKSCGCSRGTHVMNGTLTHNSWSSMKARCISTNPRYGGRGIYVCDRWKASFKNFLADMGTRPDISYSIERIDNDGDYIPGNCKWATLDEQANNKRTNRPITYQGVTMNLGQWATKLGICTSTLAERLSKWDFEDCFVGNTFLK